MKISSFNDGVVELYEKRTEKNVKDLNDLTYLSKLRFDEKSLRQQDIEFAQQQNKRLSLKIATPDDGNTDPGRLAVIGNVIYAIIHIDRDRTARQLYFYLQEVRKVDRQH